MGVNLAIACVSGIRRQTPQGGLSLKGTPAHGISSSNGPGRREAEEQNECHGNSLQNKLSVSQLDFHSQSDYRQSGTVSAGRHRQVEHDRAQALCELESVCSSPYRAGLSNHCVQLR